MKEDKSKYSVLKDTFYIYFNILQVLLIMSNMFGPYVSDGKCIRVANAAAKVNITQVRYWSESKESSSKTRRFGGTFLLTERVRDNIFSNRLGWWCILSWLCVLKKLRCIGQPFKMHLRFLKLSPMPKKHRNSNVNLSFIHVTF